MRLEQRGAVACVTSISQLVLLRAAFRVLRQGDPCRTTLSGC